MSAAGENPDEDDKAALDEVLWQLFINETRLHSDRTSFFLVANAFLLTAFAVLRQDGQLGIQFVPPSVGLAFSLMHFININYGERLTKLWEEILQKPGGVAPTVFGARDEVFADTWWLRKPIGYFTRRIGSLAFPILFASMWLVLLVLEALIL